MKPVVFSAANILLPKKEYMTDWAVVACDQFSSAPEYWNRIEEKVAGKPSMLHMIVPEAWLHTDKGTAHQSRIPLIMEKYLEEEIFEEYLDSYIYVERTLNSGLIRRGLIGMLDLEAYDFHKGSEAAVRATEATIESRIPARVEVRSQAALEFPHVLLLADDDQDELLDAFNDSKSAMPLLYSFDLMEDGGHISGWLVNDTHALALEDRLNSYIANVPFKYEDLNEKSLVFAVGDGNHSLAAAKALWEQVKTDLSESEWTSCPARYALVEIVNIHDASLQFEPIHRILFDTDVDKILKELESVCTQDEGYPIEWKTKDKNGTIKLDPQKGELACAILQSFLDEWLTVNNGKIDYIHGDAEVKALAERENSIGFLLPSMDKKSLFRGVIADGSLPRKTFSMGHANEKRYYIEGKRIR